jgi:hypothetical protein
MTIARLARSGLTWSVVVSAPFAAAILFALGGAEYYATPLTIRGYTAGHRLLRPSGAAGQTFGVAGALLMLMPFLYMARKRVRWLKRAGSMKTWLEIHLFCGVVGPVLVTFHTSFKFNGLISAAYWSMVIVVASGFVGRYLYVRIPRSLRGTELTRAELDARVDELKAELAGSVRSSAALERIAAFERAASPDVSRFWVGGLLFGDIMLARRLRTLRRELAETALARETRDAVVALTAERVTLVRRVAYLQRTRALFELWHVFHLPLVYMLFLIVAVHVGVTMYLGYLPWRW